MERLLSTLDHAQRFDVLSFLPHSPVLPPEIDPINRLVPGITAVYLHNREPIPGRFDSWFGIEVDGFVKGVRITEPLDGQTATANLAHIPGFTEIGESGPGKDIHDTLVDTYPDCRVISLFSEGVGNTGEKLTRENMWEHGVEGMARSNLKVLQAVCADEPIVLLPLSMGTAITCRMLELDLLQGHNLNASVVNFDTAIVTPNNVTTYMVGLFLPSMLVDTPREVLAMICQYGLKEAVGRVAMKPEHLKGNLLPSLVEMHDLRKGTPYSRVERVSRAVDTITCSGQLDPLAQLRMWSSLKRDNRNLHISVVPFKGHGIAANGPKAVEKLSGLINKYGVIEKLAA